MSIHTYVASKYDVQFQTVSVPWDDFDSMFYDLLELSQNPPEGADIEEFSYTTNENHDWYEIDKPQLQQMLEFLKTCRQDSGDLYYREETLCPAVYRDRLEEILKVVPDDMEFVRVEFD